MLEKIMSKKFNRVMNIAKAIGIFAIVARHTCWDISGEFFTCRSWYVPLFFFISGYFFKAELFQKPDIIKQYINYLKNIIRKYFSRFYAYHFFYGGMTWLAYILFHRVYGELPDLKNLTIFAGHSPFSFSAPNWFLAQLGISLAFFAFVMAFAKKFIKKDFHAILIFLPLAIASIMLAKDNFDIATGSEKILIRTLISAFYIYGGYLYRNHLEQKIKFDINTLLKVMCLQIILLLSCGNNINLDIHLGRLWHNISPLIAPFTGIYCVIFASKLLAPLVKEGSIVDKIGRNTLHIMANHIFVIFLIEVSILALNGKLSTELSKNLICDFYKMEKYKFLYAFLSVIICTYIGEILNFTGKIIKNRFTEFARTVILKSSLQQNDVQEAPLK